MALCRLNALMGNGQRFKLDALIEFFKYPHKILRGAICTK